MTIIASHADHNRHDFAFARTQSRYSGKLVKSPPPFGRNLFGILALGCALVLAIGAAVWTPIIARANRPHPRFRSF